MAHKGHPECEYTRKADCERAQRDARGRCKAMVDEDKQCSRWAADSDGYCGQHFDSQFTKALKEAREAARRARIDASINEFMAWTAAHPSVHEAMPR